MSQRVFTPMTFLGKPTPHAIHWKFAVFHKNQLLTTPQFCLGESDYSCDVTSVIKKPVSFIIKQENQESSDQSAHFGQESAPVD